ncbi:putative gonadotropin-releasing hormone II receptor [Hyposmocoma kahamanoa]|uniref:putative gonadotropin-releasing hormone II receptor n=1 Tax=Hyposmocoma kahamanoa TaxID=1477025 RepID=UPI000E6D76A7|nr:putative gonadotropin-releasing hormone II receptor [Hyposmocoma kahamanoa]
MTSPKVATQFSNSGPLALLTGEPHAALLALRSPITNTGAGAALLTALSRVSRNLNSQKACDWKPDSVDAARQEKTSEESQYFQCVSYGSLPTEKHEFYYFMVNMVLMYLAPLISTLYCSLAALLEIIRRANTANDKMRRSGVGILGRARARTLKMTVTIVLVFFTCWSPYYFYCMWYWIDKDSVQSLDPALQKAMWLFSCTNSCANPIVYGIFNRNRWSLRSHSNRYNGSVRRGSRFPYGESMEISAATLARARNSIVSHRRDSFVPNGSKHFHNNNNKCNGML